MTEANTAAPEVIEAQAPTVDPAAGLRARLEQLRAEREQINAGIESSRQKAASLAIACSAATAKRDRLQEQCAAMAAKRLSPVPYSELGEAQIAAAAAFEASSQATQDHQAVTAAAADRLQAIERELAATANQIHRAELSTMVAEYERRVQEAGLGRLSDQIRAKASAVSVRLEAQSPLIDREHVVVAGYPMRPWA